MENEKLLTKAIEMLQSVDPDELEIVQLNITNYDDGSVGFTVDLTYPTKEENSESLYVDGIPVKAEISD